MSSLDRRTLLKTAAASASLAAPATAQRTRSKSEDAGEVHVDAIGLKAVGGKDPIRRDTIFRISSMTKPITAAAAMPRAANGAVRPHFQPAVAHLRMSVSISGRRSIRRSTIEALEAYRTAVHLCDYEEE